MCKSFIKHWTRYNVSRALHVHTLPSPPRRIPRRRVPLSAWRHGPVPVTVVVPVRLRNDLLLRGDEGIDGAHAVLLLGAAADGRQRNDAVVDYYADLWLWDGGAGKDCGMGMLALDR